MKLKLLFCSFFLSVLLLPAESRPGHKDKHEPRSRHPDPPGRRRQRFEEIIKDIFFKDTSDDDDDEDFPNLEWLFKLQDLHGQCNPNPCHNNGVCKEKGRGRFKCDCPKAFGGRTCKRASRVCVKGICGRGECVLTSTHPFYECKCKDPFQPPDCKKYSVCEPNPCKNGGQCIKRGNDFDCSCRDGFRGHFCQVGPGDCYVDDGESYRGNVSETDDGQECLYWNSHFILDNGINPFGSSEDTDGLGPHNFCRNPDGEPKPWCFYRRGSGLYWDYCEVTKCPKPTNVVPTAAAPPSPQPPSIKPPPTLPPSTTAPPTPPPTTSLPVTSELPPFVIKPTAPAVPQQFLTCGNPQPKKPLTRIYGGLKVSPGAMPWQVSLQVKQKNSNLPYRHICGGVLIESCWVLTAGHCIEQNKDMRVVMGSLALDKLDPAAQIVEVENVIRHENYRETPAAVYNDIALLRLKGTDGFCANETQFVKTACLPDSQLPDGIGCTISGWGATETSDYGSNHLLEANVLLINQQKCSEPRVYGANIDNTMFCAGHLQGGVDSCQGDSGGPLTCKQTDTHVIYGLVSWGDQCGKKNKPGVYTRVTHFLDWIRSKTRASPV
ncbi:hyaluronan-binding protein 2 [Nothobranchius furzeri]|uniref:trypsin n=1 Tax=Nothobranchius furzeri TaxID=105023 RepID=A0A1A8V4U2_NOTFU|nr:hyaluronan-binding protein 2 [Nothobranchius furzeri]KAF7219631.1 hyaluronan binding protein 2 [Nothobranchius furzeri]